VVDRWPLVRLGLTGVLLQSGIDVVGQAAKVSEGLLLARLRGVDLVIFGSSLDGLTPAAIRSAKHGQAPPKIVVLIPPGSASAEVASLFAAGADALLVAAVGSQEMSDALARVGRGERVVGPELGPERPYGAGEVGSDQELVDESGAQGHSNKQIARALYISDATIKTHLQHIYGKLAVQSRFGALSRATEMGLIR